MKAVSQEAQQIYQGIVRLAEADERVLGFILHGARGKGFATEYSDYDCTLIVEDGVCDVFFARMRELPPLFDVAVFTLQGFAEHAAWNSDSAWDRYNWAHVRAQVEKTGGKIQALIDEKGKVPADELSRFVGGRLDHYINQFYRSIKCVRDGNIIGFRLEAAESITPLLDVLFAIHGGRLRPYYKYLQWELTEFPLHKFSWKPHQLLEVIEPF